MNEKLQETLEDSARLRKQAAASRLHLRKAVEESAAARYARASSRAKRLLINLDNSPILRDFINSEITKTAK